MPLHQSRLRFERISYRAKSFKTYDIVLYACKTVEIRRFETSGASYIYIYYTGEGETLNCAVIYLKASDQRTVTAIFILFFLLKTVKFVWRLLIIAQ